MLYHPLNWPEFEKVLGGGLVQGSFSLLAGEPGVGKSTLILELLKRITIKNANENILYVSGEESLAQISLRAKRLKVKGSHVRFLAETDIRKVIAEIKSLNASFVIIDSIQTMLSPEMDSMPGGVGQVKEITQNLLTELKERNISCIVIGHISKSGSIAGPKVLEHMVDVVMYFKNGEKSNIRSITANKNRFGKTGEIAVFKMKDNGLESYTWEEEFKNIDIKEHVIGQSYGLALNGSRPHLFEVQSLVTKNPFGIGKRVADGLEINKVHILIAIMERSLKISLSDHDIYVRLSGNLKLKTRDLDLAICCSILSSYKNKAMVSKNLFSGEVLLTGALKRKFTTKKNQINELNEVNDLTELDLLFKDRAS